MSAEGGAENLNEALAQCPVCGQPQVVETCYLCEKNQVILTGTAVVQSLLKQFGEYRSRTGKK